MHTVANFAYETDLFTSLNIMNMLKSLSRTSSDRLTTKKAS